MTKPIPGVQCPTCGHKIKADIWSMCQSRGHCYHCGMELTKVVLDQLVKEAAK